VTEVMPARPPQSSRWYASSGDPGSFSKNWGELVVDLGAPLLSCAEFDHVPLPQHQRVSKESSHSEPQPNAQPQTLHLVSKSTTERTGLLTLLYTLYALNCTAEYGTIRMQFVPFPAMNPLQPSSLHILASALGTDI
jgi:hypothetical protein